MDGTIRFWRDLLGMKLVAGHGGHGHRQYFFLISDNCYVSFFEWPDVEPVNDKDPGRPFKGQLSLDHLCINLSNEDDLWDIKD
jgi:catechol 2,3-dioxygenase-like lactoylglutathione lyase family enzyme